MMVPASSCGVCTQARRPYRLVTQIDKTRCYRGGFRKRTVAIRNYELQFAALLNLQLTAGWHALPLERKPILDSLTTCSRPLTSLLLSIVVQCYLGCQSSIATSWTFHYTGKSLLRPSLGHRYGSTADFAAALSCDLRAVLGWVRLLNQTETSLNNRRSPEQRLSSRHSVSRLIGCCDGCFSVVRSHTTGFVLGMECSRSIS